MSRTSCFNMLLEHVVYPVSRCLAHLVQHVASAHLNLPLVVAGCFYPYDLANLIETTTLMGSTKNLCVDCTIRDALTCTKYFVIFFE
jgi:nicotinamidase-related amidase